MGLSIFTVVIVLWCISGPLEVDAIVAPHRTWRKRMSEESKHDNVRDETHQPIKLLLSPTQTPLEGGAQSEIATHPLDPLTFSEIRLTSFMIASLRGYTRWIYKWMALKEPAKSELLQFYLENDDARASASGVVCRRVWVLLQHPETLEFYEAVVNLNRLKMETWRKQENVLCSNKPILKTIDDVIRAEDIAFANPDVVRRIHGLGYNVSHIVCDTWDAGYVADNHIYAKQKQLMQIYFYGMESEGDNFYAHPLDFVAYVDVRSASVRGIEALPNHIGFGRVISKKSSVPKTSANYISKQHLSLKANSSTIFITPPKGKLKPIKLDQPGGPSFTVEGRRITWQNFIMRVGYNSREGLVLHQIRYNDRGTIRPLIYRMSLSEIFVMHGDPRPPYHRKMSFDMGEFHLGLSSTEPHKETMCPGKSQFIDMVYANEAGHPYIIKDAICIFEEDAGPLWAHYDRSQGKMASSRSQRMSIGFLSAIGHSDYWITWRFYEDATIELSIKLTGLKSTNLMNIDVKAPSYGNLMSPQIYTQITQHFFAARIDADIDSEKNAVVMEDILPVDSEVGSQTNPYGNGIVKREVLLKTAEQAATNVSPKSGRSWKIMNLEKVHPISKMPVSWKLVPTGDFVPLLLKRNSPLRSNTTTDWTDHNMWVLPFNDNQIFASGQWMKSDGLKDWMNSDPAANVVNKDIVLWHVFGLTSLPAVESWPVSSDIQGKTGFVLKPNFFFDKNPALD